MSIITIIAADGGVGKTINAQRFPESLAYVDFEFPKGKKCLKLHNSDRLITLFPCRELCGYKIINKNDDFVFEKTKVQTGEIKGQIDYQKTYNKIIETINILRDTSDEYETIVFDSISDIRNIVAAQWLSNYRKKDKDKANRKVIGKDPSAWAAINKTVCDDLLFPIINIGRAEEKNIIFTVKNEDEYKLIALESGKEEMAKSGKRVMDCQNWLTFEIDIIVKLTVSETGRYFMECPKTPKIAIKKTEITNKNLYDVLVEAGIV